MLVELRQFNRANVWMKNENNLRMGRAAGVLGGDGGDSGKLSTLPSTNGSL